MPCDTLHGMNSNTSHRYSRPHQASARPQQTSVGPRMLVCSLAGCCVLICSAVGCRPGPAPPAEPAGLSQITAALDAPLAELVFAQGQLEPAGGVIPIVAPPGDRIESLRVAEGDAVTTGESVGRLASQSLRETELEVAQLKLAEARATKEAAMAAARAELEVADVGVTTRQLELQKAEDALARALASGGELDLLQQRVQLAQDKLAQMRRSATGPDATRILSETAVRQQALATQAAEAELDTARRQAESQVQAAQLLLQVAEKERRAAELRIQSAEQGTPLGSLEKQIEVLREQLAAAALTSPIDGIVLAIDTSPGQPTNTRPVLRVADVSTMVCRAEVPVALLPRIAVGNRAAISGGGLPDTELTGRVISISRLAGAPRLPSPDPRQPVDYRAAIVVIEVDADDAAIAAQRVLSQVDVAIRARDQE